MNVKSGVEVEKVELGAKPRVRDRIFETASDLFYRHGIRAVGVDAIASEAGTNKMSFYRAFPSKDDLVAEYLHDQEREYFSWWDQSIAAHAGNPRRQIEALFDSYLDMARPQPKGDCGGCKTSRGCALGNAAVEITEGNELLGGIVHEYKTEIRRRLRKLARDAGAREPDTLGDALMLLMEGGYYSRLTFPQNSGPIAAITKAARTLVDAAINAEPRAHKAR
ncbi:MAG TPA: TetR/AcrR family transcriptional regulator [Nevskia sp.]|jgi:AcrR family transcriptional regulator|nr:TetR/AcrR family transcriptional regulator [Rudaea sp.]HET7797786.1 TetR/AcrR family transcriptional regulator [Nevskia sp.]HSC13145.1 TetR/AcrR family transcriptional regulator [Rhodanobacteraceae bacterium]